MNQVNQCERTMKRLQKMTTLEHERLLLYTVAALAIQSAVSLTQNLEIVINGHFGILPFRHFWQSTGFCPPFPHQSAAGFDLSPDMVQNLAYIGAVPHAGIQQVRIHWLLDLVKIERFSSGQPVYNFTALDQLIDLLHVNGLRPGFEIMGSPSGIFTDMENKTQIYWWRDLVRQVAERYIYRYGLDYVKTWNFESWNEPDCHDFDEVKMTTTGFLNYYDACSEGLKIASTLLQFGGPADGCDDVLQHQSSRLKGDGYAEALFDHVVNGTNYFTGERGVRMDFISLHRKGNGKASNILEEELKSMSAISARYPHLAKTPFYNDEADPLVNWSKDEQWRATAAYAAMAVKAIGQHQNILLGTGNTSINYTLLSNTSINYTGNTSINYTLLGNDNGFLSFYPHQFTQRTLLARFQMNFTNVICPKIRNNYNRSSMLQKTSDMNTDCIKNSRLPGKKNYVTFVRKPIYAAMALLAKLGDQQVFSELLDQHSAQPLPNDSYAGSVATLHIPVNETTSDSFQWAVIFYSSSDTSPPTISGTLTFNWSVKPVGNADLMLAVYAINEGMSNPYVWWHDFYRKPDFPTLEEFVVIRKNEGPHRVSLSAVSVDSLGRVVIPDMEFQEPDILFLHLCGKSQFPPEQVAGLRMVNITFGQVLILWSDAYIKTKCIKTYEVEQYSQLTGKFKRINTDDTIVNVFVYATDSELLVQGHYRVRAVDYWQRPGPYSEIVTYSEKF